MMILVSHYVKDVARQADHGACKVVTDEKKIWIWFTFCYRPKKILIFQSQLSLHVIDYGKKLIPVSMAASKQL